LDTVPLLRQNRFRMNVKKKTRRDFIATIGGVSAATWLGGCGGKSESLASPASGTGGSSSAACTVYPQQTEGPFYLDLSLLRSDVTEGKPGTPLQVVIRVLRADTCAPLAGFAVDIWHCDAGGVYSGYPGQLGGLDTTGQKFLRGTQVSDADGRVSFVTIYPGWYPGRTTHIHFKVHVSANAEATSQMYFAEDATAAAHAVAPYSAHGPKDTSNQADSVNQGHVPPLADVSKTPTGYKATLTVAVA
jgi:protocatechuate 3,4-dioxygenase beta subunit